MGNTQETGHAKNVTNFDELISFVVGYGTAYNPSRAAIRLAALQAIAAGAKGAIDVVNVVLPEYSNAIAAREVAFEPLSKLSTRVLNALKASDTSSKVDENATTLVRKIQGKRATSKQTEEEKAAAKAAGTETKEVSTSHMSYDSRTDSFDKLIKLLASVPLYAPNEVELQVPSLTTLYNTLKEKNAEVLAATIPLSNARISRNEILYKEETGLVDVAFDTKTYIKSLYGATSPQYKQVSKLEFRALKL